MTLSTLGVAFLFVAGAQAARGEIPARLGATRGFATGCKVPSASRFPIFRVKSAV